MEKDINKKKHNDNRVRVYLSKSERDIVTVKAEITKLSIEKYLKTLALNGRIIVFNTNLITARIIKLERSILQLIDEFNSAYYWSPNDLIGLREDLKSIKREFKIIKKILIELQKNDLLSEGEKQNDY